MRPELSKTRLTLALTTLVLLGFLASCSGDRPPGRDQIIARIKSDPQTQGTSDRTAGCIADWYVKYATPEQISAFVNGSAGDQTPDRIAPDQQAKAAILDCLKAAADDR